jgi:hypothetical protein
LALDAQGGVRKSLQTSTVYLIATVLAQPVGTSIEFLQGIVHLAQETLQIPTQGVILGIFQNLGSIVGYVGAVARVILLCHTQPLQLCYQTFALLFEPLPERFISPTHHNLLPNLSG